ncbi:serine hydrolase [Flavobacteriaceae bacterium S356]|uniref:Serine hydrolase n=1 Tax=Asprobacillus argus TaxID=3076534 RepID=A0ABU3LI59_9FLAO|nr:serine hydrolase [Flavobacteriaceae bacterium S356]
MRTFTPTKARFFGYLLLCIIASSCGKVSPVPLSNKQKEKIDSYIKHLQKRHEIPGVSLAIIKDEEVLYKETFGKANIEHNSSVLDQSIFRVYSLTKPIVAVAVFQLIEKEKLSLEDAIGKYVPDLPLSWNTIKIKHLLTHSSGIPDMAPYNRMEKLTEKEAKELVFSKEKLFDPGEKYAYNQTNFWLLQLIIEKVSGESLEDFIIKNQFDGANEEIFFSSNSKEIVPNRVTPYFPFETGTIQIDHSSLKGRYMFAANGLNITINAFIDWDKKLKSGELINKETLDEMWEVFSYTASNKRFVYGWDKHIVNRHDSYGFSGSLVTAYRIFPDDNLSIIFLSNGLGNYYNIENIIDHIASIINSDIVNVANKAFETLLQVSVEDDINAFETVYVHLKNKEEYAQLNFENLVNDVGYQLINQKRIEKAIQVFTFNTQQFPSSANAFDSLGESYYRDYQNKKALVNYKKAIELGGTNGNARKMLALIKK